MSEVGRPAHLGGVAGGFKPPNPIHFHCVLHVKKGRGGGFQKACKIAYVLNQGAHAFLRNENKTFIMPL